MSSVSIDEELEARLRAKASEHGNSVAEEVRAILMSALGAPAENNLADAIAALTDSLGGVRLDIPGRVADREPPFGELFWDDDGEDEADDA